MSTRHPVPADALDKHIAILGKTGSGKSNLAKTIAEDLPARGARARADGGAAPTGGAGTAVAWSGAAIIFLVWSAFAVDVAGQLTRSP